MLSFDMQAAVKADRLNTNLGGAKNGEESRRIY